MPKAKIVAYGYYVPEEVLDNDFFVRRNPYRKHIGEDAQGNSLFDEKSYMLTDERIFETTGIRERRKVADHETIVDLIEKAFLKTGFDSHQLDGIIIGNVSDNQRFPSLACETQNRLDARRVHYTADVGAACSGFTHALDHARLRVQESGGHYLVAGVEVLTRMTDYTELNCDLFGDGCGLVVVGPVEDGSSEILATEFASDVSGIRYIYKDREGILRMPKGQEVLKKATRGMIDIASRLKEKTGVKEDRIKLYVPHQANGRIISQIEDRIDPQKTGKVYRTVHKYGNMSSATGPVALAEAVESKRVGQGDLVIIVDMGSGLAFGGALIRV